MRELISGLALAALVSSLPAAAAARGGLDSRGVLDRRLAFETARLAIERGEPRLGLRLLGDLAAASPAEPERALYRAMAVTAAAGGDAEALALRVEAARAAIEKADEAVPGWVEDEILVLEAALRLEDLLRARARSLDEVLAAHHRALGGLVSARRLRSFAVVGTVSRGEARTRFRLVRARPGLSRLDLATAAGIWTQVADAQAAWRADPRQDDPRPRYLDGTEADLARRAAAFDGPLVRPLAGGERLLYQGTELFRGRNGHLVERLDAAGALLESVWLDDETFLAVRHRVYAPDGEVASEIITEFRLVEGHPLPARQTVHGAAGTLVFAFEAYRLDPTLAPGIFDLGGSLPTSQPALSPAPRRME